MSQPFLKLLGVLGLGTALCSPAWSQQVFNSDVIVDGSLCVGLDCAAGVSFGFDTIRLKENNLRINFDDTSVAASFPKNDWRLEANDSANGGAERFSIQDATAGRNVVTIRAGAPANSIYVSPTGNVGFGAGSPAVKMHQKIGNTPTLRLEQDGTSGFTPQTWDLAGNEANFFIRDATNGSTLPFRIQPGAASNLLYLASSEEVGVNTTSPDSTLHVVSGTGILVEPTDSNTAAEALMHVRSSDGTAQVRVEDTSAATAARTLLTMRNNGITVMNLQDTGAGGGTWGIQNRGATNANEFRITNAVGAGEEFRLTQTGSIIITGTITTSGGTCGGGCDRVFTDDYDLPSIKEHAATMYDLGYLPNVGPTPEGEPFDLTDKLGRMLNELEHAHIYIASQQERIDALEETNAELIATLSARIDALETD